MANVTNWMLFQSAQDIEQFGSPWVSPLAALTIGGGEASSGPVGFLAAFFQTNLLRIMQPSVAGQLPMEFRLLGVEVEIRGRWTGDSSGVRSVEVTSVVGGATRKNLGNASFNLNLLKTVVMGGPTDTMNFTESDVANPGFGVQLFGSSSSFNVTGNTLLIDSLRVRIFWADLLPPGRSRGRTRVVLTRGVLS